jgi:hypothetical protein
VRRSVEFFAQSGVGLLLCGLYGLMITRHLENDPSESRKAYKFGVRRGARVLIGFGAASLFVALVLLVLGV